MYDKLLTAANEFEKLAQAADSGLLSRITRGIAEGSLRSQQIGQKATAILNKSLESEPYPSGDFMEQQKPIIVTNAVKNNDRWIVNPVTTGLRLDTLGTLLQDKKIGRQLTRLMVGFNQSLAPLIEAKLNAMSKSFEQASEITNHEAYIDNREYFSI